MTKKEVKRYNKKYRQVHKKQLEIKRKKYYYTHHKRILQQMKEYCQNHKEEIKYYQIKYRKLHKNYAQKYKSNWYQKQKQSILKRVRQYREEHKKEIKEYIKNKYHNDINFRLIHCLRTRLIKVLKGNSKLKTTMKLVGCSIKQLRKHLEFQFKEGMNWTNYGKWHIDHIIPCASFDLSKPEEQARCFHYTNLQPLWAEENLSKGDKYVR